MKIKIFLFLLLHITVCKAQIVDIVSPSLKNWIISSTTANSRAKDLDGNWLKIDQNNDGELQLSEAQNISYFRDNNGNTSNYDCMQSFANLEEFHCQGNGWTIGINLSNLVHLKKITLQSNNTTSLNLSGCVNLVEINVRQNALSTLNLTGLINLNKLDCAFNYLSVLNLTETTNLKYLDCTHNSIYSLNLTNLPSLESLRCSENNLVTLNLNSNLNLKLLHCYILNLTSLNLSNQTLLETLLCSQTNLSNLDLSNCPNLKILNCSLTQLSSINTNNLPLLENFVCNNNYISTLNLINNPNLKTLWCNNNYLGPGSLILSNQPVLETLFCHQNYLTSLDVSNCPNLTALYCYNNANLKTLNLNNGFDWVPSLNFRGQGLPNIAEICTSINSIPAIQGFYNFNGQYPSVTNCSLLNVEENQLMSQKISFSPNPAQNEIVFSSIVNSVTIYDLNGRLIKRSIVNGSNIDISDCKQGLYIINIESEDGFFSSKLIVE
jgi:Leucine-rich repeat (LRR) protein